MKFSIIIPVYNVADYLEKCVRSVLENDCTDSEILLVDDGSTDGRSGDLCDALAKECPEHIRVIHQENMGLGGARNTGIEAAQGDYLFFLDSDDYIAPETLAELREQITEDAADIYSFHAMTDNGKGALSPLKISEVYDGAFALAEHPDFLLSLPAACVRLWKRSLFTDTGIRYPLRVWYEDIRTSTKLFASAKSIVTLPQTYYFYLAREGSITRNANLERNREIIDAFDDILAWFDAQALTQTYRDELEKLAIDHVLIAGSVRVARIDPKAELLREFADYMAEKFPNYRKNRYLPALPRGKKLAYKLVKGRHFRLLKLLFSVKGS